MCETLIIIIWEGSFQPTLLLTLNVCDGILQTKNFMSSGEYFF